MEKINSDINLTNNEVKDILGTPPKWILRWGNLLLLLIIIFIASGSFFIRHPEMITGTVEIVPVKKTIKIYVPLNVLIDTVLIKDESLVQKGDALFVYINKGNINKVLAPETGRVYIQQLLSKNTLIDKDSIVMNIIPASQTYNVKGIFSASAINKIYPGQSLKIDVNNYSKEDFGSLIASIINKPVLDSTGNAIISIRLNNTTTNYGKILPIQTISKGTGYTVISNKKLIEWLLSK